MNYIQGLNPNTLDLLSLFSGSEDGRFGGKTAGRSGNGLRRTISPFDGSGGLPSVSFYSPSNANGPGGMDSGIRDVLQKLINWFSEGQKSGSSEGTGNDGSSPTGDNRANELSGSDKQMLGLVLMLLMLVMQGKNGQGSQGADGGSGGGSGLDHSTNELMNRAEEAGLSPEMLSLLEQILSMLTGQGGNTSGGNKTASSGNSSDGTSGPGETPGGSRDDIRAAIDELFNSPALQNMDPKLAEILKELLVLLLEKAGASSSPSGNSPSEGSGNTESGESQETANASTEDLISQLIDNSPALQNMDPAVKDILKQLLQFLLGGSGNDGKGGSEGKDSSPFDRSEMENLLDPRQSPESQGGGNSELHSLIAELLAQISGLNPEGNSSTSPGGRRDGNAVAPEHGSTRKEDPNNSTPEPTEYTASNPSELTDTGKVITVDEPIVVDGGVFDGKGATYTASSKLGDGSQSEGQQPIFILKNGATLKNVNIGENGADGIHVYNGATVENVHWQDVGEDALTVKSDGDVTIIGGSAKDASDKIFQVNADSKIYTKEFDANGFQTLVRTNGGKQLNVDVVIEGGSFSNGTNLFRTDSSTAGVTFEGDIALNNIKNRTRVGDQQSGV